MLELQFSTDTDTDEDEEAVAARWNNGLGEPPIIFSQPHNWGTLFWVGWIISLDLGKGCNGPRLAGAAADPIKCAGASGGRVVRVLDLARAT